THTYYLSLHDALPISITKLKDMHTILGAGGAIGTPLAKNLHEIHGKPVRLVGRNPKRVNANDELVTADLLDTPAVYRAVAGSARSEEHTSELQSRENL